MPDFSVPLCSVFLLQLASSCGEGTIRPLVSPSSQQPLPAGWLRLSQGDVVLGKSSLICSLWWKQDVKHRMGVAIAFIAVLEVILLKS